MSNRKCATCEAEVGKGRSYCDRCKKASDKYSSIMARNKEIQKWKRGAFIKWYVEQPNECYFCKITETQSEQYYEHLIKTEYRTLQASTRGKCLEVDKLNNTAGYVDHNCKLVCYYCNNAKSDVFNEEQFHPIADVIGQKIKQALGVSLTLIMVSG